MISDLLIKGFLYERLDPGGAERGKGCVPACTAALCAHLQREDQRTATPPPPLAPPLYTLSALHCKPLKICSIKPHIKADS